MLYIVPFHPTRTWITLKLYLFCIVFLLDLMTPFSLESLQLRSIDISSSCKLFTMFHISSDFKWIPRSTISWE